MPHHVALPTQHQVPFGMQAHGPPPVLHDPGSAMLNPCMQPWPYGLEGQAALQMGAQMQVPQPAARPSSFPAAVMPAPAPATSVAMEEPEEEVGLARDRVRRETAGALQCFGIGLV